MDRGAWRAAVHGITQSWTQLKWLSMHEESQAHAGHRLTDASPQQLISRITDHCNWVQMV